MLDSFAIRMRLLLISVLIVCGCMVSIPAASAGRSIDFSLEDIDGNTHTLSQYRGKWVIVNFWATSCPPCVHEMPELSSFHDRHKERDAVVLGINFEDIRPQWMRRFLDSVAVTYPNLSWGTSPATPFGLVVALPTTFIVSPDGELLAQRVGPVTAKSLEDYIANETRKRSPAGPAPSAGAAVKQLPVPDSDE